MASSRRIALVLSSVLLLGGSTLACGGEPSADDSSQDVAEGHWEAVPGPVRDGHGFREMEPVLVGGRVLIVAGVDYNQESVKTVEIDPASSQRLVARQSGLQWRFGPSVVAASDRVLLWGGCCGGGGRGSTAPGAIYDPATGRWAPLEPGTAGNRHRHSAVWTGEEMIVWGGSVGLVDPKHLDDGAAYDLGSGRWREIAPSPLSARAAHVAVWTGKEMIVWGGSVPRRRGISIGRLLYDGAAYDPDRDRWRRIAHTPDPLAALRTTPDNDADAHAAWTGTEMIVWSENRGAIYEPASDGWELIPPPPGERYLPGQSAVWTGEELVIWGGGDSNPADDGAAYDPEAEEWRVLPEAPISGRTAHAAIWTGEGMLIWGGFGGRKHEEDGAIYFPE